MRTRANKQTDTPASREKVSRVIDRASSAINVFSCLLGKTGSSGIFSG